MKKKMDFMLIIMVFCFAIVAVIFVSRKDGQAGKTDYEITVVKKNQIDTSPSVEGRVEIQNFLYVKISKNLKVKEVNYKVGDQIKKGDVIAVFTAYTNRKAKNGKSYSRETVRRYVSSMDGYILNMNIEIGKEITEPAFTLVKAEDIKLYTGKINNEEEKKNIIPGVNVVVNFSDNEKIDTEILKVEKINGSDDIRGEMAMGDLGQLIKNVNKNFRIEILSQNKKEILVVPVKAVLKKSGTDGKSESYVYLIGEDNKVEEKKIFLGDQTGESVEIKNGITEGERIILNPDNNLKNGMTIKKKDK